jgi:putative oxidoreductase
MKGTEPVSNIKPLALAISAYGSLVTLASALRSPLLLAVRLYWGWQFAQTGWGKLHNLDKVTGFFTGLNLPVPAITATCVSGLEFFGGLLLIVGLGSRLVALLLTVNMSVAYWTADHEALTSVFSDPGKFYNADPYTFWFAALLVLVFGPGRLALDLLIGRNMGARIPSAAQTKPALSHS